MKCGSIRRTTKASSFLNSSIRTNQSTKGGIKNHCCLSLSSASSLFVSITICETSQSDNREIKKSGTPLQTMQNLLKQSDGRKKEDNNPKHSKQAKGGAIPLPDSPPASSVCTHRRHGKLQTQTNLLCMAHTEPNVDLRVPPMCDVSRGACVHNWVKINKPGSGIRKRSIRLVQWMSSDGCWRRRPQCRPSITDGATAGCGGQAARQKTARGPKLIAEKGMKDRNE